MDMLTYFRRMAENNLWSNDRLHRAVAALQPGEFEAARVSFFPSIRETLNHILSVDLYYLDALEQAGEGRAIFDRWRDYDKLTELSEAQAGFDRRLVGFCQNLTANGPDRRVLTDRGEHGRIAERIGDLLTHLFLHQIHHRGQVHAMLAGTSVKPPPLDEFFLDFDSRFRREEVERLGLSV